MKAIHILRKPCSESTVAANVLRWGTGALNIDATRIGTANDVPSVHATRKSDYPQSYTGDGAGWGRTRGGYAGDEVHWEPKGGRWPANLVLQHLDGCHIVGTTTVRGDSRTPDYSPRQSGMFNVGQVKSDGRPRGTLHGDQSVLAYDCKDGCPVAALDAQSGGASRFFKQFVGKVTGEE